MRYRCAESRAGRGRRRLWEGLGDGLWCGNVSQACLNTSAGKQIADKAGKTTGLELCKTGLPRRGRGSARGVSQGEGGGGQSGSGRRLCSAPGPELPEPLLEAGECRVTLVTSSWCFDHSPPFSGQLIRFKKLSPAIQL